MLRRLHHDQPESFTFTPDNQRWAEAQMTKFPDGREASAIIPLLWRAQEQEGWLSRPAIEHVCEMLGMAYIRGLEVATFYFMFQLQPVGSVANIQICGTTSCMICGAEDLVTVCKERIAPKPHMVSEDGKFSWEEVECLGACANAPMAQIGKDYYEDLTVEKLHGLLDDLADGKVPVPGPQNGRYAAEPSGGLTSLSEHESGRTQYNASVQLAVDIGDTIKRIDGTEVPLLAPWQDGAANVSGKPEASAKRDDLMPPSGPDGAQGGRRKTDKPAPRDVGDASDKVSEAPGEAPQAKATGRAKHDIAPEKENAVEAESGTADGNERSADGAPPTDDRRAAGKAKGKSAATPATDAGAGRKPDTLSGPREGGADDLKLIKGVGPKLEAQLNRMGFYHFDQVAAWGSEEVAWVDENLEGFKGRVSRDDWVPQARRLAAGGQTASSKGASKDGRDDT